MWLFTTVGFFSIVQKPDDADTGTLTVRARRRLDLEKLRDEFVPGLGPIRETPGADYGFRASVQSADLAAAMADIVKAIDYDNFKSAVGAENPYRARTYGAVWSACLAIADEEA
ncbi:MAG: hypothetical protein AB7K09_07675 [Planctomycetota bacterium]